MNENVKRNLKRLLKEKALTPYEIGIKSDVSKQVVGRILKGGNCTVVTLEKLSKALNVEMVEFFINEGEVK